jgi:prevent-host-death family protein
METMSVSRFKATCSSVLEEVKTKKKRVRITKRGKPIAEIVPVNKKGKDGPLKAAEAFIEDIVSPVAEDEWEVQK